MFDEQLQFFMRYRQIIQISSSPFQSRFLKTPLTSNDTRNFQTTLTPNKPTNSTALPMQHDEDQDQLKRIRSQYQSKIFELQHQIKFLKDDIQYNKDVHQRQLENLKALLEYQYTVKIRDTKSVLRQQFIGHLNQNLLLKDRNKQLQQQIKQLKQRFDRSEKYSKELQQLVKQSISKVTKQFEEEKQKILKSSQKQAKQLQTLLRKQCQKQVFELKKDFQKQLQLLNQRIQNLCEKLDLSQKQVSALRLQLRQSIVRTEQLRIEKDNIISQQKARLDVLRQQTIINQMTLKKQSRENRLSEINKNVIAKFEDEQRKKLSVMEAYRLDIQRQIIMEKQILKISQNQTKPKPLIKKVNQNRQKRQKQNERLQIEEIIERQASECDTAQFGYRS